MEDKVIDSYIVHEEGKDFIYEKWESGNLTRREPIVGVDIEMDKSEAMMCEMAVKVEYLTAMIELGMEV